MVSAEKITVEERVRRNVHVAKFLARHPREVRTLPRWVREHSSSPTALRTPWWPFPAADFLKQALPPSPRAFEFGSGGSTLWLEDLGARVTAVEHDRDWFDLLSRETRSPTELILREPAAQGTVTSEAAAGHFDAYVSAIDRFEPESFDLVTVDGRARVEAGLRSIEKVRSGGWLVLDDSWRTRYKPLRDALVDFEGHHFEGLRPSGGTPSTTSCWRIGR